MAKRSYTKKRSQLEEKEVLVKDKVSADVEIKVGAETAPETTTLVLTKDVKLNIVGPSSETLYVFNGAGSKVPVLNEDVEGLLQKKNRSGCCPGGTPSQPYFQIYVE